MSEFCKKYEVKEATMKALIKDGWITCSLPKYDEVYYHYKSSGSMQKTADHFSIPKSQVWTIVHKYE